MLSACEAEIVNSWLHSRKKRFAINLSEARQFGQDEGVFTSAVTLMDFRALGVKAVGVHFGNLQHPSSHRRKRLEPKMLPIQKRVIDVGD